MKSPLTIYVTIAEIAAGKKSNAEECPIALAMLRAGLTDVAVTADEIVWAPDHHCTDFSPTIRNFVHDFDHGRTVIPFHFTLSETWRTEHAA